MTKSLINNNCETNRVYHWLLHPMRNKPSLRKMESNYMTEKQTNRFTAFTFCLKDEREVRCDKNKMKENRFHHHEVKL